MLADLCIHFPEVRQQFDLVDRVFAGSGRVYLPSDAVFPRPAFSEPERKAAEERIWQMEGAVEAVLIANRALCGLLGRLGIRPDALVGHSTGDYSAMAAAGMIDLNDEEHVSAFALELNAIYRMGAESGEITPTALFAVGGPAQAVRGALGQASGDVHVVMDNCPHQTVIAGPEGNIASWVEALTRQGLICERLPWDRPYHSPGFEAYARRLEPLLARWITAPPSTPVYSCMTISRYPDDLGEAQRAAYQHWLRPVEFGKTIEAMYGDGVRIFVEVSAGGKLASFVDDILRGQPHLAVAANVKSRPGITQLNHLVGALAAHGVPVNLDLLYASRAPRAVPLTQADAAGADHKPSTRMKLATGWPPMSLSEEFAAQLRGKHAAQSAPPAAKAKETLAAEPSPPTRAEHPTLEPATASKVMVSYLQTMDQFLAVQGEVMQAFLTGRALAPASGLPTGGSADVLAASTGDLGVSELSRPPAVPGDVPPLGEVAADAVVESLAPAASVHPAEARALDADALCAILLRLVSDRTGYPTEMLSLDLDLEANLGIDSIKRVEILGTLQKQTGLVRAADMEALAGRKTLREIIAVLAAPASAPALPEGAAAATEPERAPSPSSAMVERPPLPFVDMVISHGKGQEVLARVELSLDKAPFLRDHTLGRAISVTDPGLRGLPIVPFTVGMEILAETASLLVPGARLTGMRDVQAHRWMALDTDRLGLEVAARRLSPQSEHAIYACIREAEPSAGRSQTQAVPIMEGVMLFGERLPEAPAAGPFVLSQERPSTWIADRLYGEVMFHGPLFRGVASITRTGDDGVEASLNVRPASDLLGPDQRGALITDPILLDQPGQVVGFWTAEHLDSSYVIFPYQLQELRLYDAALQVPGQARCRARVELLGDWQVRSDLEVLGPDDRLAVRFVGWEDRRFDLPDSLFGFLLAPAAIVLSQPMPALVRLVEADRTAHAFCASVDAFPQGFFAAHGGIWQRVLAHSILSRRERELWTDLSVPEGRRIEWLLGRMAAKDAVRCAVKQRFDITLAPADFEILPDRHGRPVVAGAWLERAGGAFQVSLAHTAGTVVAVAVDQAAGIGVDIEHIAHLRAEIGEVAFTAGEQALLGTDAMAAQGDRPLRLWCAKEAAAKAIGRGMLGGPQSLEARAFDPARGTVEIALRGALAEAVPGMNGRPLTVWTAREGDLVMALSLMDL
jgi:malonyl CoA-acyl carrier protein transacylase/phosphopantetheinyl transferase